MGVYAGSKQYGDIFQVSQAAVDRTADRLYREQQQRELEKRQQDKMLDDEFGKNVAGIKSSDVGEVGTAYNDYKQSHIALQKKGQRATPQDNIDLQIKKAKVYSLINASKEDKQRILNRITEVKTDKKGRYNPDAHTTLGRYLNTPTSKRQIDKDDDELFYKYSMPDIDKDIKTAVTPPVGKETVDIDLGVDPQDALKDKKKTYKVINPPNAVYNNLYTSIGSRPDHDNFSRFMLNNMSDAEKNKLRTDFELKISDPEFKAVYGEVKPFPESASKTDLGQAVALKVMEAFVNLPLNSTEKSTLNADRAKTRGLEDAQIKMRLNDQLIRGRMRLAQSYRQAMVDYKLAKDAQQQEGVLNTVINQSYDNGSNAIQSVSIDGKEYKGRVVDVPKEISDQYIIDKGYKTERKPDKWYLTEDKKTIIPLYLGEKTVTNGNYINPDSKPVDVRNYKISLGKLLLTQKQRGAEVIDEDFFSGYKPEVNKSTKEVKKSTNSSSSSGKIKVWN